MMTDGIVVSMNAIEFREFLQEVLTDVVTLQEYVRQASHGHLPPTTYTTTHAKYEEMLDEVTARITAKEKEEESDTPTADSLNRLDTIIAEVEGQPEAASASPEQASALAEPSVSGASTSSNE